MTKEELEKEAFEYAYNKTQKLHSSSERDFVYKIYLEIAEPREKQIADLEEKLANANNQLEDRDLEIKKLKETYRKQRNKRIDGLQKENAELKQRIEWLDMAINSDIPIADKLAELEKENEEQKETIKNCNIHIKNLEICNDELEIRKQELEKENEELRNNGFTVSATIEQQLKADLERGRQLEKEVKNILKNKTLAKAYEQFANAKQIIRDFIAVAIDYIDKEDKNYSFIVEAEQFLKENE